MVQDYAVIWHPPCDGPSLTQQKVVVTCHASHKIRLCPPKKALRLRPLSNGSALSRVLICLRHRRRGVAGDGKDAFLHVSVLNRAGLQQLPEGTQMLCTVGQGAKGPQVLRILEVLEGLAPFPRLLGIVVTAVIAATEVIGATAAASAVAVLAAASAAALVAVVASAALAPAAAAAVVVDLPLQAGLRSKRLAPSNGSRRIRALALSQPRTATRTSLCIRAS